MKFFGYAAIILLILLIHSPAIGDSLKFDSIDRGQHTISLSAGYSENHRIPTSMRIRFASDVIKLRFGKFTSPRTEVSYELVGGQQIKNLDGYSVAGLIGYRRYFAMHGGTAISYDLGIGAIHLGEKMDGLATRNNFTEYVGLTLQQAVGEAASINIEYRFSHISNAGTKKPNVGINSSVVMIGYSWYK